MEQEETRRKPTVRGMWEEILRLVYPPKCVFCGALLEWTEQDACKPCLAELPWTDTHSAVQTGRAFSQCVSPFFLTGKVHQALVDYKYHQRESYGVCFGRWMGDCACRCLSDAFDLVTWVPVSRKRLRKRGFDQARYLAGSLCVEWHVEPQETLRKILDNPPQSGLEDADARRANVLGAYEAVHPERIAGKRFLLVDDICTTGSTLGEAARVLRQAGAADVLGLTLAVTREE